MKILLLEDDFNLAQAIKEVLILENFIVDIAYSSKEVYELTFNNNYDLYIFDINLIDENGIDILNELRDSDDFTPTIYITALTDLNTIEKAFKSGADDYIKKPFEVEELLIRIKAKFSNILINNTFEYDFIRQELKKENQIIPLGPITKKIFHNLIMNKNNLVSKQYLISLLETTNENSLRVHINKLKKLGFNIKNIRSEGYILEI